MSTEAKFIPGPWINYGEGTDAEGLLIISIDGGEYLICEVQSVDHADDDLYIGDIINANAHLIAAAPKLYDALYGLMHGHDGAIDAARIALAEARGEIP